MKRQQQLKKNKEMIKAQKYFDLLTEFPSNPIFNESKSSEISDHITDGIPYVNGKGKEIIKLRAGEKVMARTNESMEIFIDNLDDKHMTNPDRLC